MTKAQQRAEKIRLANARMHRDRDKADRERLKIATQVARYAALLPDQAALKAMLLQEPDPQKRHALYSYIRPHLKFASHFPSELDLEELIIR